MGPFRVEIEVVAAIAVLHDAEFTDGPMKFK
jgi:hypothetical protein